MKTHTIHSTFLRRLDKLQKCAAYTRTSTHVHINASTYFAR